MAPQIQAIELARYRGFRDAQRPELLRLNLVYGENNAGKSALVRVPALLAASRTPGRLGLDLGEPVRRAGFQEVRWRGPLPDDADSDLVLGVGLSDGSAWRWTFRWLNSRAVSTIQRIELSTPDERVDFERVDLAAQDPRDAEYVGPQGPQRLVFDGLIPRTGAGDLMDRHRDGLAGALDGVIWLQATRQAPTREGTSLGAQGVLTGSGEGAAARVASDAKLRSAVSAWFLTHAQCRVDVEFLGTDRQRLVLEPVGAPSYAVPFPDSGEGLQQVFPLVVALEHLRRDGGLLCVEEPESHLHPRLQRGLVALIVDVLRAQPAASVLLETHSEVFLIAALAAAVGALPAAVRLYWVEAGKDGAATIEDVPLDPEGRPTTPRLEQAFDTMGVMRRELIQARRAGAQESRSRGG
ncbi:AAA family ATPase [Sorangium sp. So ce321]|uniref:AAA family ATPase n=1 Tax=Sorangium sp. So ce321 TaxID=3133300 RepID=UPI003F6453DF